MVMPEMDGSETFRRIRELDPQQAILIYSGFAENQSITNMLALGRCRFLRKPFRYQELHNAIAQIVPVVTSTKKTRHEPSGEEKGTVPSID